MKSALALMALAAGALALGACKEKKPAEADIITTRYEPQRTTEPIAMPADSQTVSATWMGKPYSVTIVRTPVDSLKVSDDNGQKYIDNRCRLTIRRQDGSVFTEKHFSKASFRSYIQEPFVSRGILAGIRFDEADGQKMEFSVVVAMPEAVDDLFLPLELTIDSQEGITIKKDDDMGLRDYEDEDDAEDEADAI